MDKLRLGLNDAVGGAVEGGAGTVGGRFVPNFHHGCCLAVLIFLLRAVAGDIGTLDFGGEKRDIEVQYRLNEEVEVQ